MVDYLIWDEEVEGSNPSRGASPTRQVDGSYSQPPGGPGRDRETRG